jgi:hypothetical protein
MCKEGLYVVSFVFFAELAAVVEESTEKLKKLE